MRWIIVAGSAALLAACGSQVAQPDAGTASAATATAAPQPAERTRAAALLEPDLSRCPERELLEEGLRQRTTPVAVPAVLRGVMRSGMDNFAVVTLDGSTVCVDASWIETVNNAELSPDKRFVAFDWGGYEAFGHVIVDRAGDGAVLDTGVRPVASPSGRRLASADLGESGFGALNAFAVWRVEPQAVRELAAHEDVPPAYDWRIDGWRGESCIDLSAVAWETFSANADGPRQPYRARERNGWRVEHGRCAGG